MSFVYPLEASLPPEKPFEPKYLEIGKKYLMLVAFDWNKEETPGKILVEYIGKQRNGGYGFKLISCFNKNKQLCKNVLDKFKDKNILIDQEINDENINYSNLNMVASFQNYHMLSSKLIEETAKKYDINRFSKQDELKDFIKKNEDKIGHYSIVYRLFVTFFTYSDELHSKLKNTALEKIKSTTKVPSEVIDYEIKEYLAGKRKNKYSSKRFKSRSLGGKKKCKRKTSKKY